MGGSGLRAATETAILNANYLAAPARRGASRCSTPAPTAWSPTRRSSTCGRRSRQRAGITNEDVAKRLIDHGFHAPTMSWPVAGTLMIEPTESESKAELDRFCDAMLAIRRRSRWSRRGTWPRDDNPLVNAPHPAEDLLADDWEHAYPRDVAAYPSAGRAPTSTGRRSAGSTTPTGTATWCAPARRPSAFAATKGALFAVSRSIEALAGQLADGGDPFAIIALFEDASYFAHERRRYARLAAAGTVIVGFVGAGRDVELPPGVHHLDVAPDEPLSQEWSVLVLAPAVAAGLVATDLHTTVASRSLERGRLFGPQVSSDPAWVLEQAERLLPGVDAEVAAAALALGRAAADREPSRGEPWKRRSSSPGPIQFGTRASLRTTTIYHFLFVPLSIGLAPLVAIFHTQYVRTGRSATAGWRSSGASSSSSSSRWASSPASCRSSSSA
jgi:hypothetical protein